MSDTDVQTDIAPVVKNVAMWKVVLHNDDFTPMEFVVAVLRQIFQKPNEEAVSLMMRVHTEGKAVVGLYTREIAETKVQQTSDAAERFGHPLLATAEQA